MREDNERGFAALCYLAYNILKIIAVIKIVFYL